VNARKHERSCSDKGIVTHSYFGSNQGQMGIVEVVRPGTKVDFLGHHALPAELDLTQCIEIGTVANATLVMKRDVPRHLNSSPLMYKWGSFDFATEKAQPNKPPGIQRFWRPGAKNRPNDAPM
jgi:hypothetical protein